MVPLTYKNKPMNTNLPIKSLLNKSIQETTKDFSSQIIQDIPRTEQATQTDSTGEDQLNKVKSEN